MKCSQSGPWTCLCEGWEYIETGISPDEVKLLEKLDSNGLSCLKTVGKMPCPAKELFEFLNSEEMSVRQKWDSDIQEMRLVEKITNDVNVVYRTYKTPSSLISPREFVAISGKYFSKNEGVYYSYGTSVNHKAVNGNSKYVRANAILTGFVTRPLPDKKNECLFVRIIHVDPKGMIPAWVISLSKKLAAQSVVKLKKIVLRELPFQPNKEEFNEDTEEKNDTRIPSAEREEVVFSTPMISIVEENPKPIESIEKKISTTEILTPIISTTSTSNAITTTNSSIKQPLEIERDNYNNNSNHHQQQQQQQQQQQHNNNNNNNNIKDALEMNGTSADETRKVDRQRFPIGSSNLNSGSQLVPPMSMAQVPNPGIERVLENLQTSMEKIHRELYQNREELQRLEANTAKYNIEEQIPSIGWDFIGFALIWPFVTYLILDLVQRR